MKYKLKLSAHDVITSIISVIIICVLISISYLSSPKTSDLDYAVVRYNNKIVKTMPLSVDDDFVMKKEDSPLNYCSYLGEISNRGSSLICAPNCVRVTIESLEGDNTDSSVDIIL